ncbi:MAG: TolC family protein [Candidatus Aminicenantes bacterium]
MKTRTMLLLVVIAFCFTFFARGQDEDILPLSLEDCIVKALEDNLNLAIQVYTPEMADMTITQAKEYFMPSFDFAYGRRRTDYPSYWWLQGEESVVSKYGDYSISLTQQIPTGGSFSVLFNNYRSETNELFQLINPRYGATLQFDFVQPLLRNGGLKMGRKEIIIAENNLEISQTQFESVVQDTVYTIVEAYWNLLYAIEDFKVKQQSLQLARDLLEKNKKEVEVGKLAPLEVLNAETVVAQREADILAAEVLIKRREDLLKYHLNMSDVQEIKPKKIVPMDRPDFVKKVISFEEAWQIAQTKRPDLRAQRKTIENNEFMMSVAKNKMLPGLDLSFSYWSPGISGDKILYLDDNPLTGIVIGKEEGGAGDAIGDAFKFQHNNWNVALTLTLPLANVTTRAEYVKSRMEVEKSRLEMEDKQKFAMLDVNDAVREVETHIKRVEAYRLARELAQRRLEAEEKKLDVGLTTNYFVLTYQEELANARSTEIKSMLDYILALARLDRAMGASLESWNVRLPQTR